jgi:hypothetical protein
MAYHASNHRSPGARTWAGNHRGRRALGADTAPAGDPAVRALQQQLNRFISRVLPEVLTHAVPVTGVMDMQTAQYAARILVERAKRAKETYADAAHAQYYTEALSHLMAPRPWVDDNLKTVTADVKNFGDSLGLPPASGTLSRLVSDWRVWVAAAGVGVLVLGRRRRR